MFLTNTTLHFYTFIISLYFPDNIVHANPCTKSALEAGRIIHVYPYDTTKFFRCDYLGKAHISYCPYRQVFSPTTLTCEYQDPGAIERTAFHNSNVNPCVIGQFQSKDLYHKYTPNPKMWVTYFKMYILAITSLNIYKFTYFHCHCLGNVVWGIGRKPEIS